MISEPRVGDAEPTSSARVSIASAEDLGCAVCGSRSSSMIHPGCTDLLYWLPGRFDIVRCRQCRLLRTRPGPAPGELGMYYPSSYVSYAPTRERGASRRRKLLNLLLRLPYRLRYGAEDEAPAPTTEGRLLDIGSGTGDYAARMAAAGWDVSIIEPNRRLAAATGDRLALSPDRVWQGAAEEASFPEESFDMVSMSHVLEHLVDPVAVLQKTRVWLRPEGRLRVWVPNAGSWEARAFGRRWHGLDVPRHLHHFEPDTLRQLLERCGFRVERVAPQFQTGSLAASMLHVCRAAAGRLGRRRPYRRSALLYHATLIPGSILVALGNSAYLDVTAVRS